MTVKTPSASRQTHTIPGPRPGPRPGGMGCAWAAFARRLMCVLCALAAGPGGAEVVAWLYDAEVPVASQTDAARQAAAAVALARVLARASGLAEVPRAAPLTAAMAAPERYILSYSYRAAPGPPAANSDEDAAAAGARLRVRFHAAAVRALLREAELPVWGADRPAVLVWLAVRDGRRGYVVGADETAGWARGVAAAAERRGLVVMLPLMDMTDAGVSAALLWGRFWEQVAAASARYRPDLLVVGRAVAGRDDWAVEWSARPRGRSPASEPGGRVGERFSHRGASPETLGERFVDDLADALAARFAVRGDQRVFAVTVRGAQTVRGYAALLEHLGGREHIDRVDVVAATPETLKIRLHTRSGLGQLQDLLAQDDRLAAKSDGANLEIEWLGPK